MDAVVLINGLGNQMSQYAFYLQKKKLDRSTGLISFCNEHNGFELNKVFNLEIKMCLKERLLYVVFRLLITEKLQVFTKTIKALLTKLGVKIIREDYNYNFNKEFLSSNDGINFYFGGWHAESYFDGIKKDVLEKFNFRQVIDAINLQHVKKIEGTESVSIHVRRGDYLNSANIGMFGGVATIDYYQSAIDMFEKRNPKSHFFVFSNDLAWVSNNLKMRNVTFIDNNTGENSWKDMFLMTKCKHNIIANSTFSWWGAWLNKNDNKIVVCPSKFLSTDEMTEVYPKSWIRIDV